MGNYKYPLIPGETAANRQKRLTLERVHKYRAKQNTRPSELDDHPEVAAARAYWETCKTQLERAERHAKAARHRYIQAKRAAHG